MGVEFDAEQYGPVFSAAIRSAPATVLDGGTPSDHASVADFDTSQAFAHAEVRDTGMADCCAAGVWLLHNDLERAHTLCQDVPTPSGSFWHGVVHRREGDFGNASYWFARCSGHPVISSVAAGVADDPSAGPAFADGWSPESMIDLCRRAMRGDRALTEACLAAQQIEWQSLFGYCYAAAVR